MTKEGCVWYIGAPPNATRGGGDYGLDLEILQAQKQTRFEHLGVKSGWPFICVFVP